MSRANDRWVNRQIRHQQDKLETAEEKGWWDRVLLYDIAIDKIVRDWYEARGGGGA